MGYVKSGVKISGLNEAVAGLKAMGADKELSKLNLEIGNRVVKEARELVPVKTGNLKGSIRSIRSINGVTVKAGRDPQIPYANAQNWGWFYDRKHMQPKNILPTQFMNKGAGKVLPWIKEHYIQELIKVYERFAGK
ncbi:MAG: HK97 gp10 family phage protein [Micrococcales bacterium]|nr:HK97 gp10 family phage protein [Actinomycetota bacterium]NCA07841.1 HK97 gp10 family phage protein [Micrococcales bacterium]